MLRSSYDACGCSTQTTFIINLKRSTLHPHEGQADRPNTPSDSLINNWFSQSWAYLQSSLDRGNTRMA
jgi:hypothetical protein